VIETARLTLHRLTLDDAAFILALVNEPAWLQYIGDRGVRTIDDARNYIRNGPMAMYERLGYGLWLVRHRVDGIAMGLCGLLKRDSLDAPDIGFAFKPAFWGHGYAREAAAATLEYARTVLGVQRVLAVVLPGNSRSINLLERLQLSQDSRVRLADDAEELLLFSTRPIG